jgi:hypothetical protein
MLKYASNFPISFSFLRQLPGVLASFCNDLSFIPYMDESPYFGGKKAQEKDMEQTMPFSKEGPVSMGLPGNARNRGAV